MHQVFELHVGIHRNTLGFRPVIHIMLQLRGPLKRDPEFPKEPCAAKFPSPGCGYNSSTSLHCVQLPMNLQVEHCLQLRLWTPAWQ